MKITKKDMKTAAKYRESIPKQFGNLHERMQYLMELARRNCKSLDNDLWQAIHDLETEVSYYEPQSPPFGRRTGPISCFHT